MATKRSGAKRGKVMGKAAMKKTKGGDTATPTATAPRDSVSGNATGRRQYKPVNF